MQLLVNIPCYRLREAQVPVVGEAECRERYSLAGEPGPL